MVSYVLALRTKQQVNPARNELGKPQDFYPDAFCRKIKKGNEIAHEIYADNYVRGFLAHNLCPEIINNKLGHSS